MSASPPPNNTAGGSPGAPPPPSNQVEPHIARKIFIGNLPRSIQKRELEDLFREFGEVVFAKIKNGKADTFGFVDFATDEAVDAAINKMDGYMLYDRRIAVQRAKGMRERKADHQRRAMANNNAHPIGKVNRTEYRCHVDNIPRDIPWQQIKDYFSDVTEVSFCEVLPGGRDAIVEFPTFRALTDACVNLDGKEFEGRTLVVTEDRNNRFGPNRQEVMERGWDRKRGRSPFYGGRFDERKRRRHMSPPPEDRYYDDPYYGGPRGPPPPGPHPDDFGPPPQEFRRGDRYPGDRRAGGADLNDQRGGGYDGRRGGADRGPSDRMSPSNKRKRNDRRRKSDAPRRDRAERNAADNRGSDNGAPAPSNERVSTSEAPAAQSGGESEENRGGRRRRRRPPTPEEGV